ncbi:MAG TPA: PQQ-binding-like beta-propeller repeat protein, partial [Solirubrobacteraceae bacterium]
MTGARADVQDLPDPYFTTDGAVFDLDRDGEDLLIGGQFARSGRRTGARVAVGAASGTIDRRLPEAPWNGRGAAPDGAGGWYLPAHHGVAHYDDGRRDPAFERWIDGRISTLWRDGDVLYVGGDFDAVGGDERHKLAALDARTGELLPWQAGSPPLSPPRAIRVLAGRVYVLATYPAPDDHDFGELAAYDAKTGEQTVFSADDDGLVWDLEVAGGRLFASGSFDRIGGRDRSGLAELDPLTGAARAFDLGLGTGSVEDMAVDPGGDTLRFGGSFTEVRGQARHGFAAVDLVTGALAPWDPRVGSADRAFGYAVAVAGDRAFVAAHTGGGAVVASVDTATGADLGWAIRPDDTADEIVAAEGADQVIVSGRFAAASTVRRTSLARIRAADGAPSGTLPAVEGGPVHAMARDGDVLYLGGAFTKVGGRPRARLAAVDLRTGAVLPWAPSVDWSVWTLAVGPDAVFVGGYFAEVNGAFHPYFAALDRVSGATLPGWDVTGGQLGVTDLELRANRLFVAGDFAAIQGVTRAGIASLDATTGAVEPWSPQPDGRVDEVEIDGDRVYLGGAFAKVGGRPREFAAAVDPGTGEALDWAPEVRGPVGRIAVGGERVHLAGLYDRQTGRLPAAMLTVVDRASGAPLPSSPSSGQVLDVLADPHRTIVAGQFWTLTSDDPGDAEIRGGTLAPFAVRPLQLGEPFVTGAAEEGETLTCHPGEWRETDGGFAYAWLQPGERGPVVVDTGQTHVATRADADSLGLACRVRAMHGDAHTDAQTEWSPVTYRSTGPQPTPTATPTPTPAPTATAAPTTTATPSPSPAPDPSATATPAPSRGAPAPAPLAPAPERLRTTFPAASAPRATVLRRSARRLVLRLSCPAACRVRVRVVAHGGRRCASRAIRLRGAGARRV